jgi:hypothetical protein
MARVPLCRGVGGAMQRARFAGNMRQKAGPGLPLHLPILYRKGNSNLSGYASFALASGLKGFVRANFGQILGHFCALRFLEESMIGLNWVNVGGQCSCHQ